MKVGRYRNCLISSKSKHSIKPDLLVNIQAVEITASCYLACMQALIHTSISIGVITFTMLISACSSISYYGQSINGQLEIANKQQDINQLLQSSDINDDLRHKLKTVIGIREFASSHLGLPDNDSYKSYADIGRDYVVWNIFATPELSLEPLKSCFLIIGCLNYRGYFSKEYAQQYAMKLQEQGYDVFIGGVTAYSTLGWFDDPVLNTMFRKNDTYLSKVIFHELAHQRVYIKDDTEINEAFADTVALIGVKRWLQHIAIPADIKAFGLEQEREEEFVDLVMTTRQELDALYQSNQTDFTKLVKKEQIFNSMRFKYKKLRTSWNNDTTYDAWFENGLNNAKLSAVITYRKLIPSFINLLDKTNDNLEDFYNLVEKLDMCPINKRREILEKASTNFNC